MPSHHTTEHRSSGKPGGAQICGGQDASRRAEAPGCAVVRLALTAGLAMMATIVWVSPAEGIYSGRNGALLVSTGGMGTWSPFPPSGSAPSARPAECAYPSTLWTVWPDGSRQAGLGFGDTGLFSPKGQRLAIDYGGSPCYEGTGTDPSAGLFVSDVRGAKRHRITGEGLAGWLANGQLVVWQNSPGKVRLLDAMSALVIMTLPAPDLERDSFSLSCSARLAVVRQTQPGDELDVFTRKAVRVHGRLSVRIVAQRVASSRYPLENPTWSPDGRRILFMRTRATASSVTLQPAVVMDAHGSDQKVLVNFCTDDSIENPLWSPDGRSIAVYPWDGIRIVDASTGARTATIPLEGAALVDWQAPPRRPCRSLRGPGERSDHASAGRHRPSLISGLG